MNKVCSFRPFCDSHADLSVSSEFSVVNVCVSLFLQRDQSSGVRSGGGAVE